MLTIGHSTLPLATFLGILQENEVGVLVDVRTVPKSRHNPQFAGDALSASLGAVGIGYHWAKALGGLRHPRPDSINNAWRNRSFRGYADYMQMPEFKAAVDGLIELASGVASRAPSPSGTVIMCAEAVPWRCHRSLVGDALLARGVEVEDIFYDQHGASKRKPHTLTSFAQVDGDRVWYPAEDPLFPEASQDKSSNF